MLLARNFFIGVMPMRERRMAQDYEDTCPRIADDVSCHFALVRTNGADRMTDIVADALATAASAETARIVSTLIRMTGDFTLAEDCLQDAFAKALVDWRVNTVPENPGAWLTTVAKNRAIDVLRRAAAERRAPHRVAREPEEPVTAEMPEGVSAGALAHPMIA